MKAVLSLWAAAAAGEISFTASGTSYVGGDFGADGVFAVAADSATNSYIGGFLGQGWIQSDPEVYPTEPYTYNLGEDAFVAKLTPSNTLAWYICLGSQENDRVTGLALGPNDLIFAAGFSERTALNDSGTDAYLWAVNRDTGANLWATTFGRSNTTNVLTAVATDTNGYAYAVGYTSLTGLARNVSGYLINGTNYGTQLNGNLDACVLKVAPNGSIVWFHYLGGANADAATACALAADGSVYVAGETRSPGWVATPSGTPGPADKDGFLVKLTADGTHVWSTFLGGSGSDALAALTVNAAAQALFVGGVTESPDFLSGAERLNSYAGGADGFVAKLTDSGPTFAYAWCRFLGGGVADRVAALALQTNGTVVAGGTTASGGWLAQAGDSSFGGVRDGFLCALDSAGDVAGSAYIGGSDGDELRALAPVPGTVLAAGSTLSSGWVSGGFWSDWNKLDVGDFGFVGAWRLSVTAGTRPVITGEPSDLSVQEGQPAVFHVTATGTKPLAYRWLRNGSPVTELTSNTYVLAAAALTNDNDRYACVVSNDFGVATSRGALLTVTPKPKGTLTVTLAPVEAAAAGAAWSIDSGLTWLGSGASTNLTEGLYAVAFKPVSDWTAPAGLTGVQVLSAQTTSRSGTYVYAPLLPMAERAIAGSNVVLSVRPPPGTSAWQLSETLPAGLEPASYSAGGSWTPATRILLFSGVGTNQAALSYAVGGALGDYTLGGSVLYAPSGTNVVIAGDTRLVLANVLRRVAGLSVALTVSPPAPESVYVWSVEETLPAGLTPQNIAGPGASWNAAARKLTWVLLGNTGASLTYDVAGAPGSYTLVGRATFGGPYEAVFGDSGVTVPEPPVTVPSPDILSLAPAPGTNALLLTFISLAGQAYRIQTNATLDALTWSDGLSVTGDGSNTVRLVPMSGPRLFYRVRAAP